MINKEQSIVIAILFCVGKTIRRKVIVHTLKMQAPKTLHYGAFWELAFSFYISFCFVCCLCWVGCSHYLQSYVKKKMFLKKINHAHVKNMCFCNRQSLLQHAEFVKKEKEKKEQNSVQFARLLQQICLLQFIARMKLRCAIQVQISCTIICTKHKHNVKMFFQFSSIFSLGVCFYWYVFCLSNTRWNRPLQAVLEWSNHITLLILNRSCN